MICEKITVTSTELNTGIDVIKDITRSTLIKMDALAGTKYYNAIRVIIKNNSGISVNCNIFTDVEYSNYLTTPSLFGTILLANGEETVFYPKKDKLTKIVAKGTTGHTGSLDFIIVKE